MAWISDWLLGWQYRKKITIDQTKVDENLSNFPVLVKLTSSNFDFSKARSDGFDFRFTSSDGTTLLKYERERHDATNQVAEYWVKIPSISATTDTVFYIYYGKTDATDGADPTNVWDTNHKAVWHLKETGTNTRTDSTSNANNGTPVGGVSDVEGKIDGADSFDGTDDYIDAGDGFANFTTGITVEVWAYPTASGLWARFIDFANGQANNNILFARNSTSSNLTYEVFSGSTSGGQVTATGAITNNEWHHYVATEDGSGNVKLYKDGVLLTSGTTAVPPNITRTSNFIGRSNWSVDAYYSGYIDEVRISDVARSAAWIKASYNSSNNTLVSYSTEEQTSSWKYRKKIIIDHTKIDADLSNFPVLVKLTSANFNFSKARSDGFDFRFTSSDGTTLLSYERERHDANNQVAEYWVKIPSVSSTSDTYFYLYYGNSIAYDGANPTNVWDANHKAVWHLKETGTATRVDSTSNGNNGTPYNGVGDVEGKIDGADSFDGTDDYIQVPHSSVLNSGLNDEITLQAWIYIPSFSDNFHHFFTKGRISAEQPNYAFRYYYSSPNVYVEFYYKNSDDTTWHIWRSVANTITTNNWYLITLTFKFGDGTSIKYYVNGVQTSGSWFIGNGNDAPFQNNEPLWIGRINPTTGTPAGEPFNGLIDEIRISNIARSAAWVKSEYYSGNNTLLTLGAEQRKTRGFILIL